MSDFLSTAVPLLILISSFVGLVAWARRDSFTGAHLRFPQVDAVAPDRTTVISERTVSAPRTAVLQIS